MFSSLSNCNFFNDLTIINRILRQTKELNNDVKTAKHDWENF